MIMYCSHEGDHQVNAMICAFSCPHAVKMKCAEYKKNYEKLKKLLIDGMYLTKYGLPNFPDPNVTKKERKQKALTPAKTTKNAPAIKKAIKEHAKEKPVEQEVKPKRTRRTKKQMEEARRLSNGA